MMGEDVGNKLPNTEKLQLLGNKIGFEWCNTCQKGEPVLPKRGQSIIKYGDDNLYMEIPF